MSAFSRTCTGLVVALAFCVGAWVDVSAQPNFELGFKAGFGFSKLTGDDTERTDQFYLLDPSGYYFMGNVTESFGGFKPGLIAGVYATVQMNDQFGLRLEGLYTKKGGKGDNSGQITIYDPTNVPVGTLDLSGENKLMLDYFEIPLLAVVSFPVAANGTFDLFAGPAMAFKVNAEFQTEVTLSGLGVSETQTEKVDISDEIKGTDFGGVLGAGFTFDLQQLSLFGEGRWTYGFSSFVDSVGEPSPKLKNSAFGLVVGVGIPLARTR